MVKEKEVGKVINFFEKPSVAVVKVFSKIKIGDKIHVKGITSDFEQIIESMQIEHKNVEFVDAGQDVGLKVLEKVRLNDLVYLVE